MIEPNFNTKVVEETQDYAQFVIEPLPFSFGQSMGNALRRTLLSSLPGAALTSVRVVGAPHQFSTIKGVKESVLDIVLTLKSVRFSVTTPGKHKVSLSLKGAHKVYARDIEGDAKVVNGDLYLAEITDDKGKLEIEGIVETGYGFVASEDKEDQEPGHINIDSSFSPVKKVNFKVEEARVGRKSDFERLVLEVWTDESIKPSEALKVSATILAQHFSHLFAASEQGVLEETANVSETAPMNEETKTKLDDIIIDELNLPSRVINALLRENIETVADLIKTGRKKLIGLKGVGRKSIDLIDEELKKMAISLE